MGNGTKNQPKDSYNEEVDYMGATLFPICKWRLCVFPEEILSKSPRDDGRWIDKSSIY